MNTGKRILLLNGSPKINKGTSGAIAAYLMDRIKEKGCVAEALIVKQSVVSAGGVEKLLSKAASADTLVLAFPLYIDSLPYPVIKAFELIVARRKESGAEKRAHFLAIVNSGFPEAHQNETALSICRRFAEETGLEWAGGFALGGGQAIDGSPLEKMGWLTRNVRKSLDLAADALASGEPLPEEAVRLMAKPLMPKWVYRRIAETGGKRKAKRNGAWEKVNDQPYADR